MSKVMEPQDLAARAAKLGVRAPVLKLFREAHRRRGMGSDDSHKPLDQSWIGLGMPSTYRPGVAAGLFRPLHDRETARVLNWYLFAEKGIETYKALYGEHAVIDFEAEGRVAHDGGTGGFALVAAL
jgi:hypothetical protein